MTNIPTPSSGTASGSTSTSTSTPRGVRLGDALAAARADLHRAQPPAYIEAQLLANLQANLPQPARSEGVKSARSVSSLPPAPKAGWNVWQWLGAGSGGAGAAFAAFMAWALLTPMSPMPAGQTGARDALQTSDFVSLASAEDIARAGAGWVMATDVSQAQLTALGLPFNPARAADTVSAELLVAGSGDVLAVRLVN